MRLRGVRVAAMLLVASFAELGGCKTFITSTTCEMGKTACGGIQDARFCEYKAVAVEGPDCASLGLVDGRPFCVVTPSACTDTSYAVKDGRCSVLRYESVRESIRADCAPGTPTFVSR
jgi:hypothetical protein